MIRGILYVTQPIVLEVVGTKCLTIYSFGRNNIVGSHIYQGDYTMGQKNKETGFDTKYVATINYYKNMRSSSFIGPMEPIEVLIRKDIIGIFNSKEDADKYLKNFKYDTMDNANMVVIQVNPLVVQK